MNVGVTKLYKMERKNFENVCTANLNIYTLLPTVWLGRQWVAFCSAWPSERSDRWAVWEGVKQHFMGPRCDPQNKDSCFSCYSWKYNYICSRNMVFQSKNGSKIKIYRNGLLATLSENFRKYKIRISVIKQKMNVTMSLLDDIKTKQLQWYGHVSRMEDYQKKLWNCVHQEEENEVDLNVPVRTGLEDWWEEKGLMEDDWNDRSNWRKKILQLPNGHRKMWEHYTTC